ncbi:MULTISPECIES: hypothetical protein [unclassified Bacillus cereus group]|nr:MULTISPECIES: hypothetical protein [unclassified Bacillus cereus group]
MGKIQILTEVIEGKAVVFDIANDERGVEELNLYANFIITAIYKS